MTSCTQALRLLMPLTLLGACADYDMVGGATAEVGVTAGGAQDIGLAREIIEAGYIPSAETFTAEGLLSEHDLPLSGEVCDDLLCPRAAAAQVLPIDDRDARVLVQLGFGTRYEQEAFARGPLDLALCVDVSGSMEGEKLAATRVALQALVDQLEPEDHVSLVTFDDSAEVRVSRRVMDAEGVRVVREAVDALREDGGTDMEEGMALAYAQLESSAGGDSAESTSASPPTSRRLMLFTDAQPNTGDTSAGGFLGQAREAASEGVGISVFGLGLDLGTELATAISEVRGGNHFTLLEREDIESVFDEGFDLLVTPVAYDLDVVAVAAEGLALGAVVGAPTDDDRGVVAFGASTLFLSESSGGMGIFLQPPEGEELLLDEGQELARFSLSYEDAFSGELVEDELSVRWEGGSAYVAEVVEGHLADDEGVFKMAGLLDEFGALRAGASFCEGGLLGGVAADRMRRAQDRMEAVDIELGDDSLSSEHQLMGKLRSNLSHGAVRCW